MSLLGPLLGGAFDHSLAGSPDAWKARAESLGWRPLHATLGGSTSAHSDNAMTAPHARVGARLLCFADRESVDPQMGSSQSLRLPGYFKPDGLKWPRALARTEGSGADRLCSRASASWEEPPAVRRRKLLDLF